MDKVIRFCKNCKTLTSHKQLSNKTVCLDCEPLENTHKKENNKKKKEKRK